MKKATIKQIKAAKAAGWSKGRAAGKYIGNGAPERNHSYESSELGFAYEEAFSEGEDSKPEDKNPYK